MQEVISNFVRDVMLVAKHEAKKELIKEIADHNHEPVSTKESVQAKKRKRAPKGEYGQPEAAKVLEALDRGVTQGNAIAEAYGWNRATTSTFMRRMEERGLIGRTGVKNRTRWFRKQA